MTTSTFDWVKRLWMVVLFLTAISTSHVFADVPVVTGPLDATGYVGTPFTYQITASDNPTSYFANGLPPGLSLNTTTGLISGTPTLAVGTVTINLGATNSVGTGGFILQLTINPPLDTLISQGKTAVASSVTGTNTAAKAFDGLTNTRWESVHGVDPQWIYVDLGSEMAVHRIQLNWETAAGKNYALQVSDNSVNWTSITNVTNNTQTGVINYPGLNANARYVRMYGTARTTAYGYSLFEFQVFGTSIGNVIPVIINPVVPNPRVGIPFFYQISATNAPTSYAASGLPPGLTLNTTTGLVSGTPTAAGTFTVSVTASNANGTSAPAALTFIVDAADTNLVLNHPATASSSQTGNGPTNANDGNNSTRWAASSGSFPQTWTVDLGSIRTITRVDINWYNATSRNYSYELQASTDNVTFYTLIYNLNSSNQNTSDLYQNGANVRYVRVVVTGASAGFASFSEVGVFGH